jgi:HAE1 family hydrophobic/amphiphilic exporter-1
MSALPFADLLAPDSLFRNAVLGGLLFSQFLTLFVTPVFYVYLDRLPGWLRHLFGRRRDRSI